MIRISFCHSHSENDRAENASRRRVCSRGTGRFPAEHLYELNPRTDSFCFCLYAEPSKQLQLRHVEPQIFIHG